MQRETSLIRAVVKRQSRRAADELISGHYREIYAFVYRQVQKKELAMDLTQEIFIGMLQSLSGYDEKKGAFRPWLYQIASYHVVDYFRSKGYRRRQAERPLEECAGLMEDTGFERRVESDDRVLRLLGTLPAEAQQLIRLKVFGDCTFEELAERMGIPESTVKTRYYAALRRLRKEEERYGEENG